MVQINIGRGQGLTQAIRDKIGAGNIKHSNLETWQKVMTEVNSAQSKEKSIFNTTENNTTDINKLADRSSWGTNFVVDEGNVEIDDGVWNKIKALLTGKTDVTPKADTKVVQQQTFTSDSNNVVSSQSSNATSASLESKQPATDNQRQQVQILGSNKTMTVEERDKEVENMLGGLDMPEGIDVSVMNIAGENCYVFKRDGKTISLDDVKQEAQAQKTAKEHENQREQALDASQTEVKNDSVGNQVQQANHSSVQSKPQNITSIEQVQAPKVTSKQNSEVKKEEVNTVENKPKGSELYDSEKFYDLYSVEANKKFLGEYSSYILSSDSNDVDVNKHGYLKSHVAGAMNAIVFLKPSHSMVLDDGGIRIEKNNDNSITIKYNYDDDNTTVTFNQDGSYRSGNLPPDEYSNTFANYVDEYLAGELLSGNIHYE